MDSLSLEEKAELNKNSTERLKAKLVAANVSEAIVNAMDRTQMLDAVAKLRHPPVVVTPAVAAAKPVDASDLFNLLRLEHETWEKRFAAERERAELVERARRDEREADRRRVEDRWQQEMSAREKEYQLHSRVQEAKLAEENSLLGRTKKFSTAIKDVFPLMPKDSAELPTYFESID